MSNTAPELLTVKQAAEELGITRSGLHYRILAGKIETQRLGSQHVITRDELDRAKAESA